MRIDLHTHSTVSDGTDTPGELVRNAAAAGLDVVALTDHDTVGGHAEAREALPPDLTLVTGAELSCRLDGVGIHLLAYLFDAEEPELARCRERLRDDRVPRARGMVDRLRGLGVPITWEQVARIAGLESVPTPGTSAGVARDSRPAEGASVGRPHLATALVELGVVGSVSDAFTADWLGDGGRAYVAKYELDPFEAVELVRQAGGVAVLAHPGAVKRGVRIEEETIARLAAAGLDGLEVDHMDHDGRTRDRLRTLAGELGLLTTGSSDYHGSRKSCSLGENTTDPEVYEEIVRRATGARPVRAARG
ncbi:PHP domain-containing protein [Streptomyces sp. TP-A0874]|uniref:PHP domain-containing protein n=1 Tax=Streptomyces sp. TP-A0874 TaxID=549819 RepID=UPI000853318A|nr:PHP domain-containing protein [Streptomyces sp. TP-A0874]